MIAEAFACVERQRFALLLGQELPRWPADPRRGYWWGIIATTSMGLMAGLSALPLRMYAYELFLALHIILAVLSLFSLMPERSSLLPSWFGLAIGITVSALMIGVWLGGNRPSWLRVERAAMLALATALLAMTLLAVTHLVMKILDQSTKYAGRELLTVGIEAWVTNVLAFSIIYWDIDRGGPENRTVETAALSDWLFPQAGVPIPNDPFGRRSGGERHSASGAWRTTWPCKPSLRRLRPSWAPGFW